MDKARFCDSLRPTAALKATWLAQEGTPFLWHHIMNRVTGKQEEYPFGNVENGKHILLIRGESTPKGGSKSRSGRRDRSTLALQTEFHA